MMIRVINESPTDIVGFMIEYLKEKEQYDQQNNFSQMLASMIASRKRLHNNSSNLSAWSAMNIIHPITDSQWRRIYLRWS